MSLVRAVTAGTLAGAVAAFGIYVSLGPDDLGRASLPATPTYPPVPTPTVTQIDDCVPPAVLKKGFCVTTKPGPKVTATVPSTGSPTSAQRTAPAPAVLDEQDDDQPDEHDEDEDEGDDEADD